MPTTGVLRASRRLGAVAVVALTAAVLTPSPAVEASGTRIVALDTLPVTGRGVSRGAVILGGLRIPHAVLLDGDAARTGTVVATWTLRGRCTALEATVAWPAPAPNGALARVAVVAAGRTVVSAGVAEPRPVRVRATLHRTPTLRVVVRFPTSPGFGVHRIALLDPRLSCSADPRH